VSSKKIVGIDNIFDVFNDFDTHLENQELYQNLRHFGELQTYFLQCEVRKPSGDTGAIYCIIFWE